MQSRAPEYPKSAKSLARATSTGAWTTFLESHERSWACATTDLPSGSIAVERMLSARSEWLM